MKEELTKEFVEWLIKDNLQYPHGRPKSERSKFEEQPQFIKDGFEVLAKSDFARNYYLAYELFKMKTEKGISEDIIFDTLDIPQEDLNQVKRHFQHFMDGFKENSRRGGAKLFKK